MSSRKHYGTLLLFPTSAEANGFKALRPDVEVYDIGVGMAQAAVAAASLVDRLKPDRVVLCGIAGRYDDRLSTGQVVEVAADSVAGLPAQYDEIYDNVCSTGLERVRAYTVNRVGEAAVSVDVEGGELPVIEQMEGAAVAAVCRWYMTDYVHLRAISNRVGDDRAAWRIDEAVTALGAVAAQLYGDDGFLRRED